MMESPQWPRKFVCSWCSERWNVAPWPQGRTLKDTSTIGLDAAASSGASLGFTRPLLTMQYYLDHDHPAAEPCVRGLCQQARDSLLPGCCDGNVAESPWESAYRCVMDHCDVVTDARHKMKKHLNGNKKKGHDVYLSGLAGRIKNHGCLSKTDQAVFSRLMNLFNDLDSRGQIPMSQSVRTVLGADEISSPAVVGEHRQWMVYLGLHCPETQLYRPHLRARSRTIGPRQDHGRLPAPVAESSANVLYPDRCAARWTQLFPAGILVNAPIVIQTAVSSTCIQLQNCWR
ncbi:hypothetical protein CCHR01_13117 [Colletotrichum chrysophilum]|uniref:Uncharacterized protein n=1 Tax=Colletotrichum chrysophilum TaxID=1836956 RepID=A0AAD9AA09_9PEZI|nr:hypothetical protein CCHR01_13117 [Colletotrichum chrysophilum]